MIYLTDMTFFGEIEDNDDFDEDESDEDYEY
jgi:hypothetical protein